MLKAVIDSNVLVSAALAIWRDYWNDARVLFQTALLDERRFESVTSLPILYELGDVLSRPRLELHPEYAVDFMHIVGSGSTIVGVYGVPMGVRDSDDDKVVETAMNSNADAIVTRDRDLYDPRASYSIAKTGIGIRDRPIRVVGVVDFLSELDLGGRFSPLVRAGASYQEG